MELNINCVLNIWIYELIWMVWPCSMLPVWYHMMMSYVCIYEGLTKLKVPTCWVSLFLHIRSLYITFTSGQCNVGLHQNNEVILIPAYSYQYKSIRVQQTNRNRLYSATYSCIDLFTWWTSSAISAVLHKNKNVFITAEACWPLRIEA